jgi:hypothetical protein
VSRSFNGRLLKRAVFLWDLRGVAMTPVVCTLPPRPDVILRSSLFATKDLNQSSFRQPRPPQPGFLITDH